MNTFCRRSGFIGLGWLAVGSILTTALLVTACQSAGIGPQPADSHGQGTGTPVAMLNGSVPLGKVSRSMGEVQVLHQTDEQGNEVFIMRTTRAPGTRSPIHLHDYGGTTCVLEGEMTLFMEGAAPQTVKAGGCYYMPPGHAMSGSNQGSGDAVMLDSFKVPVGQAVWRVVEPGTEGMTRQFSDSQH